MFYHETPDLIVIAELRRGGNIEREREREREIR